MIPIIGINNKPIPLLYNHRPIIYVINNEIITRIVIHYNIKMDVTEITPSKCRMVLVNVYGKLISDRVQLPIAFFSAYITSTQLFCFIYVCIA